MKYTRLLIATVAGLALSVATSQAGLSLGFSSDTGSTINFFGGTGTGGSFNITPGTIPGPPSQWHIGSVTGGTGSALGLEGYFSGVPAWTYGPIVTVIPSAIYTAAVSPGGTINIWDGVGLLTGSINWIDITTVFAAGSVNTTAAVNISGMVYGGANADLVALAGMGSGLGSVNLTFQFAPGLSLLDLAAVGASHSTSYSGSIAPAPVPEASTMLAGALVLVPFALSGLRRLRKS